MDLLVSFAEGFMNLFQVGADNFVSWVTGIVPTVLILLIAMNTLIALIGQNRINRFAKFSAKNPLLRYMVVPFLGAFMLGNPMALSMGKFMPEFYKPAYYDATVSFVHPITGLFPHANAGELFVYQGIAAGITALELSTGQLAVRYFLVGVVVILIRGIVTERITVMLMKKQAK